MLHRFGAIIFVLSVALLTPFPSSAADALDPAGVEFFEKRIRPLLAERCFQCHSEAAGEKLKAGLHLDVPAGIIAGGDNGPVIVPGDVTPFQ
jgi:hypothetical protein